jgi:aldehyde oxidoreductase
VVRSCVTRMGSVPENANILTIEGIGTQDSPHPLELAWARYSKAECGYCSPGFIVSAKGLLDTCSTPSRRDVREWFRSHRNICRCAGPESLVDAVMVAGQVLRGEVPIADLMPAGPGAEGRVWNTSYCRCRGKSDRLS